MSSCQARATVLVPLACATFLAGCLAHPEKQPARSKEAPVTATFASRPLTEVERVELEALWDDVQSEEFERYVPAARQIVQTGLAAIPFLLSRLDERRMALGQPVPIAQALVARILAAEKTDKLHETLRAGDAVVRFETARVLETRAEPASIPHLRAALRDPDEPTREAVKNALAACEKAAR